MRKTKNMKVNRKKNKTQKVKKWTTALEAAQLNYNKTGSLTKAKQVLKKQALFNARKLFGSI